MVLGLHATRHGALNHRSCVTQCSLKQLHGHLRALLTQMVDDSPEGGERLLDDLEASKVPSNNFPRKLLFRKGKVALIRSVLGALKDQHTSQRRNNHAEW